MIKEITSYLLEVAEENISATLKQYPGSKHSINIAAEELTSNLNLLTFELKN